MILKRHKNQLYDTIQSLGFDVAEFHSSDLSSTAFGSATTGAAVAPEVMGTTYFTLYYREKDFRFEVEARDGVHGEYHSAYSSFPLRRAVYSNWGDFSSIVAELSTWLTEHVAAYIEEVATPDLWSRLSATRALIDDPAIPSTEQEQGYTEAERLDVKRAVERFRTSIVETFHPSEDQMAVVSERIDYLIGAVDRLNRRDWRGLAISTVIGIATTLSLDTDQGRVLFGLLQQAFRAIQHLLGG